MSDVLYPVKSGFYNSVNGDRVYDADDMCRPYQKIITEGIIPENGARGDEFEVVFDSGMTVIVKAGDALLAGKWFSLEADQSVTLAVNASANPRIDSIILQVDRSLAGRAGSIVYRQGTPAASPTAPAINTVENCYEWRLANIAVAAGASSITQADITDLRGTDTPWAKSLLAPENREEIPVTVGTATGVNIDSAAVFLQGNTAFVIVDFQTDASYTAASKVLFTIDDNRAFPYSWSVPYSWVTYIPDKSGGTSALITVESTGEVRVANAGVNSTYRAFFSFPTT